MTSMTKKNASSTRKAQSTAFKRVPDELVAEMLGQLRDRGDLSNCCLVSRRIMRIGYGILHRKVTIGSSWRKRAVKEDVKYFGGLSEALRCSARDIVLRTTYNEEIISICTVQDVLKFAPECQRLSAFISFDCEQPNARVDTDRWRNDKLRHLDFYIPSEDPPSLPELSSFTALCRGLTSLNLWVDPKFSDHENGYSAPCTGGLKSLRALIPWIKGCIVTRGLIRTHSASLEVLSIVLEDWWKPPPFILGDPSEFENYIGAPWFNNLTA
jgi:hypothetical protein